MCNKVFLCNFSELEEMQARSFDIGENPTLEMFIVRKNNRVYGYKNTCPHARVNLNWVKDQFLDYSNSVIQCSMHFAQFEIENGYCFYGPCKGKSLEVVDLLVEKGKIFVMT